MRLKKATKITFYAIILLILLGNNINEIYAFSIDPSRAEVVVEPGKKVLKEYLITNPDNTPIKVQVSAEKWAVQEGRDATSWIKVWPNEVTIPPDGSKKVKCEVTAPREVSGEYTSSLVFKSLSPAEIKGIGELVAQLRVVTYVVIKGTEKPDCEISKIEVLNTKPLGISVKVKNSGNIHVRPKGKAQIVKLENSASGAGEKAVVGLKLNPIEAPIFPGSEGEIGAKAEEVNLEPGIYKVKVRLEITPELILNKEVEFTAS